MKSTAVALLAAGACGLAHGVTLIQNGFNAGAEGWTAVNGVDSRAWVHSGGDPGAFIQATAAFPNQIWVFVAPPSWLDSLQEAMGGSLSWSMKVSTVALPIPKPFADVKIGGAGLVLAADAGPDPGLTWSTRSVNLVPGVWHLDSLDGPLADATQIAQVLAAAQFLQIRGKYSHLLDTGSLDTVVLSAVPELPTAVLALVGVAALSLRRRPPR